MRTRRCLLLLLVAGVSISCAVRGQRADLKFEPPVDRPAYPSGDGPTLLLVHAGLWSFI